MKLSVLPLILSAGLAILQVSAAPIRVVIVSGSANGIVRVGHAGGSHLPQLHSVATMHAVTTKVHKKPKHGCAGARAKALQMSNWFRHALGLPIIEKYRDPNSPVHTMHAVHHGGMHAHQHAQAPNYYARPRTFMQRLTHALMILGPWEGRAVSFILGCGIGVLLRMFWVLAVLAVRSAKGKKEPEEFNEDEVIFEEEERLLAPPQYVEENVVTVNEKGEKAYVAEAPAV